MHKLGLNILGDANFLGEKAHSVVRAWRSPFTLVMNNYDYAATLKGDTTPIHRHWQDDNISHITTPAQRYHTLRSTSSYDNGVILYTQNEPSADIISATWEAEIVRLSEADGVGVVVGNFGYGGPEDWEVENNLLPLLREIAASNKRRRAAGKPLAYWGVHEYYDFHDWRYIGPYKGRDWNVDPLTGNTWLIGRFLRTLAICDKYGIEHPPILVTEHGSDSNRDDAWHGWRAGVGLSQEVYAKHLLDMQRLVYNHPAIKGVLIFTWGENWDTFDIRDASVLHSAVAAAQGSAEPPPVEPPVEPPAPGDDNVIKVKVNVVKRQAPGGDAIGTWVVGEYPTAISGIAQSDGKHVWRSFRLGDEFWFSATGPVENPTQWIEGATDPVVEPPPVVPPPLVDDELVNDALMALDARIRGVEDAIEALKVSASVDGYRTRLEAAEQALSAAEVDVDNLRGEVSGLRAILNNTFGAIIMWASEGRDATGE